MTFFANAVSVAGDMKTTQAEELLDDLSTDGEKIHSDKIAAYGTRLLDLTRQYGIDVPLSRIFDLLG
jgi:hypothetical protein